MSRPTFKDRLATARLPERSVPICLRGDLVAEHEELDRELKRLQRVAGQTLGDQGAQVALAEQITALEEQIAEETDSFRVRALPRHEWDALVAKHPPSEDDGDAKVIGADLESLMQEAIPRCVVEPEMDANDWERLAQVVASRTWDTLSDAVWAVNRGGSDIPKSLLAWRVIARASDEQKQPESTA